MLSVDIINQSMEEKPRGLLLFTAVFKLNLSLMSLLIEQTAVCKCCSVAQKHTRFRPYN